MPRRFVRYKQLRDEYGIPWSRQHISLLEKEGKFPRRVQLGGGTVGWWADELEAWQESRERGAKSRESG